MCLKKEYRNQNASFTNSRPGNYGAEDVNPPPYQEPVVRMNMTGDFKHDDYLFFSIFNLLCCFAFLGIPAVFYSFKSRKQFEKGLFEKARKNAKFAKKLNIAGLIIGALMVAILILIQVCILLELKDSIEKNHKKEFVEKKSKQAKEFQKAKIDQDGEFNTVLSKLEVWIIVKIPHNHQN